MEVCGLCQFIYLFILGMQMSSYCDIITNKGQHGREGYSASIKNKVKTKEKNLTKYILFLIFCTDLYFYKIAI